MRGDEGQVVELQMRAVKEDRKMVSGRSVDVLVIKPSPAYSVSGSCREEVKIKAKCQASICSASTINTTLKEPL